MKRPWPDTVYVHSSRSILVRADLGRCHRYVLGEGSKSFRKLVLG